MRPPLARPGHLADAYADIHKRQAALNKMLRLANSEPELETHGKKHIATAAGDERKLRGIPCIARGVPGSEDPLTIVIRNEHSQERHLRRTITT